ncbi:uncharacterized protein LOC101735845 isoform X1 [Bombyx mori]|uniref:Uncharacterized protein n=1 Tax=Bombyx mori TaxID=7091 RepID=A0A8R2QXE4_BOMMO|nr:uncharacterized protein LOC101735845 isoform X1 [Bombyx mori]
MICNKLLGVLLLCLVHDCLSKPTTEHDPFRGRGIGSTIWGWITYPFTWWSSGEPELAPGSDQLLAIGPDNIIEIGKHNVTIWCNDQTCTTMKCDRISCRNVTCNIYDTDITGECREYNTITPADTSRPTEVNTKPENDLSTLKPTTTIIISTLQPSSVPIASGLEEVNSTVEERPLELEAVLSSTVMGTDNLGSKD